MTRKEFIDLIGEDPVDMFGNDWENDAEKYVKDVREYDHMCSGNCRRVGCNCDCGEWHKEIDKVGSKIGSMDEKMEEQANEIQNELL